MEPVHIHEVINYKPTYTKRINELLNQLTDSLIVFTDADLQEIILSPASHLFFISQKEKIVGMMTLGSYKTPTGSKYWLEDVVIDNAYRGKSLGKKLVTYAIDYVKQQGDATFMLTSNPQRVAANMLYQSIGFQPKETNVYKMIL